MKKINWEIIYFPAS